MTIRSNKQIWRLAEHLFNIGSQVFEIDVDWSDIPEDDDMRHQCYDEAKKLMYMIQYNAFTGPDNHGD